MKRLRVLLAGLIVAGCGGGGGGGGGGAGVPGPSLTALAVTPSAATIAVGETLSYSAVGTFSDGSTAPVSATWTSSSGAAIINGAGVATGTSDGIAIITAAAVSNPAIAATASLEVRAPVVYGVDAVQGVVRYAMSGGAPVVVPLTGTLPAWSKVSGVAYFDDLLYMLETDTGGASLYVADLATNVGSFVTAYPAALNHYAVVTDKRGRVYAAAGGIVYRYDPETGGVSSWAPAGVGLPFDLAIDASDNVYAIDLFGWSGLVSRVSSSGSVGTVVAAPPGFFTSGGVATASGQLYFAETTLGIYRAVDLDADGDYLDAGEVSLVSGPYVWASGVLAIPSGLLVNELNSGGTASLGIHLLTDLNGDSDFLDAGEKTLWSADGVSNDVGTDVMTMGY